MVWRAECSRGAIRNDHRPPPPIVEHQGRKGPTLANPVLAIQFWANPFLAIVVLARPILAKTNFGQSNFGSGVCHGPKGWFPNPEKSGPEGWGPEGWGAQNLAFHSVSHLLSLTVCLLVVFWWCLEALGLHTKTRELQTCTFDGPGASKTPPLLNE